MSQLSANKPFKHCACCQQVWPRAVDLVLDPALSVCGYQAFPDEPELGLFLLTHCVNGCYTTIGVRAGLLRDFYNGPCHTHRMMGEPDCPGHCLDRGNLETCDIACDLVWVRHVLQYLRRHELPPHIARQAALEASAPPVAEAAG